MSIQLKSGNSPRGNVYASCAGMDCDFCRAKESNNSTGSKLSNRSLSVSGSSCTIQFGSAWMEKVNNLIIFFRPTIIDPEKNSDQGFT